MKVVLFSGTHPRHLYIHECFLNKGFELLVILMQREELMPLPPAESSDHDKKNFLKHFQDRLTVEKSIYGNPDPLKFYQKHKVIPVNDQTLNSDNVVQEIKKFNPDMCFVFGTNLIKDNVLSVLPPDFTINLHLGLSPWYKGSATLFWPFYNLEPQFAGSTFHKVVLKADAGDILHQTVPTLKKGDRIHDVAANVVIESKKDLEKIVNLWIQKKSFEFHRQKSTGRLYLTRDFRPEHLRMIYDIYDNQIVDRYLDGSILKKDPVLFTKNLN